MFEHDSPADGATLRAWRSEAVGKIRVSSSPGGIAPDADEARGLRDALDGQIAELDGGEGE